MYDVTNRDSFVRIENWLAELDTYSTNTDIVKMLVGNKVRLNLRLRRPERPTDPPPLRGGSWVRKESGAL